MNRGWYSMQKMAERGAPPPPRNVVYVRVRVAMHPVELDYAAIRRPRAQTDRIEKPQETEQE